MFGYIYGVYLLKYSPKVEFSGGLYSRLGIRMRTWFLLIFLGLVACAEETPAPTGPTQSSAEQTNNSGSSGSSVIGFQSDYYSRMGNLIDDGNELLSDYNALMNIWNATNNLDYASSESAKLLSRAKRLLSQMRSLSPPVQFASAHQASLDAFTAIESSLKYALQFYQSNGLDQNALLQANIKLQDAKKYLEKFNQEKG